MASNYVQGSPKTLGKNLGKYVMSCFEIRFGRLVREHRTACKPKMTQEDLANLVFNDIKRHNEISKVELGVYPKKDAPSISPNLIDKFLEALPSMTSYEVDACRISEDLLPSVGIRKKRNFVRVLEETRTCFAPTAEIGIEITTQAGNTDVCLHSAVLSRATDEHSWAIKLVSSGFVPRPDRKMGTLDFSMTSDGFSPPVKLVAKSLTKTVLIFNAHAPDQMNQKFSNEGSKISAIENSVATNDLLLEYQLLGETRYIHKVQLSFEHDPVKGIIELT